MFHFHYVLFLRFCYLIYPCAENLSPYNCIKIISFGSSYCVKFYIKFYGLVRTIDTPNRQIKVVITLRSHMRRFRERLERISKCLDFILNGICLKQSSTISASTIRSRSPRRARHILCGFASDHRIQSLVFKSVGLFAIVSPADFSRILDTPRAENRSRLYAMIRNLRSFAHSRAQARRLHANRTKRGRTRVKGAIRNRKKLP